MYIHDSNTLHRKNLGLSAKKFARYLSVNNATLSRWENDRQELSVPHDRLIRLVYASIKGLSAGHTKYLIEEAFTSIRARKGRMPKIRCSAWQSTLKAAGITRRIRPYDLRHYFATRVLEAGGDITALSQVMGSSPKTLVSALSACHRRPGRKNG